MNDILNVHIKDFPQEEDSPNVNYNDGELVIMTLRHDPSHPNFLSAIKIGFNIFFYCHHGELRLKINGNEKAISSNQLLICPSSSLVEEVSVSNDIHGSMLSLSDNLLKASLHPYTEIWNKAMYVHKFDVIDIPIKEIDGDHYGELIKHYIQKEQCAYRREIIHALLQSMLLDFCGELQNYFDDGPITNDYVRGKELFDKFMYILQKTDDKRQPVTYYADLMAITPKYLSRICKEVSGKTALEWIQSCVNDDISYYLRATQMSIKQIAQRTGFPDMSSFGKYVRHTFGCSPTEYRTNANQK